MSIFDDIKNFITGGLGDQVSQVTDQVSQVSGDVIQNVTDAIPGEFDNQIGEQIQGAIDQHVGGGEGGDAGAE